MFKKLLTFCLILIGTISLNAQGIITGTVTDIIGGAPIANQTINIYSLDSNSNPYTSTANTNSNGVYSFNNVPTTTNGYMVYTLDCQQQFHNQVVPTNNGTANFSICSGTNPVGCSASFNYMIDSAYTNLIYYHDQSTGNPTSWTWNFGDGNTSNLQHPTHQYLSGGTYTVTLLISSSSCTDTISQTIVISGPSSSCNAAFYFNIDSLNQNTYHFIDNSTSSTAVPISWNWDFGEGNTSSLQNPSHTYASNGTYTVTLQINSGNCFDTTSISITVGNPSQNNYIYGYVNANSSMVNSGTVSLFDPNTNQFVATTTIDSSYYLFGNVPNGTYKILATPDTTTSIGQNFAPTYYGDVIFWAAATSITLPAAVPAPYPINLVTIPAVPGGNGSISGNVGTGAKSGSANTIVNLLDNNMALVTTTKTNANGDYNFSNLAMGTYKIWVEIAGKTTTPITVTLTTNDNSANGNDFVVNNSEVLPKTNSISNNSFDGELNLFPNPVVDIMNIELSTTEFGNYDFNVYNITGQLISTIQINISSINSVIRMNTSELSQGTYFLRIENSNSNSIQKLFVK